MGSTRCFNFGSWLRQVDNADRDRRNEVVASGAAVSQAGRGAWANAGGEAGLRGEVVATATPRNVQSCDAAILQAGGPRSRGVDRGVIINYAVTLSRTENGNAT